LWTDTATHKGKKSKPLSCIMN